MNGQNTAIQYRPPLPARGGRPRKTVDSMVDAFREHCQDEGTDYLEYVKDHHMADALDAISRATQRYLPHAAIRIINEQLEGLIEIAVRAHRQHIEQDEADQRERET